MAVMLEPRVTGDDDVPPAAAIAQAPVRPIEHRSKLRLTAVAWVAPRRIEFRDWVEHGRRLGLMGRNAAWWIGDWLRFGNAAYGEKYTRAAKITGYDVQTLMNMVHVASRFEDHRRREMLSWSHHAAVAACDRAEQDALLCRAESERLSVRDLREIIRVARRAPTPDAKARRADSPPITCPACGHRFGPDHRQPSEAGG